MVNTGKILANIQLEHVRVALGIVLVSVDGGVDPFAFTTGIAIVDEPSVQEWFNNVHQCVMHHAVAEWGGGNHPGFAFVKRKLTIAGICPIAG